jgi:hypothetical protein
LQDIDDMWILCSFHWLEVFVLYPFVVGQLVTRSNIIIGFQWFCILLFTHRARSFTRFAFQNCVGEGDVGVGSIDIFYNLTNSQT